MYIIFLMMSSVVILLARRTGWKPILWTSFAFWVLAQFGFRAAEHTFMMHFIPTRIPIHEMGAFDLWAWQLLWIVGIWLGVRWAQDNLPIEASARKFVIPAAVIACALFILRRVIAHGLQLGATEWMFDKWHLGPLRLLDFVSVAALLIVGQSVLKRLAIRPLVLMGQSSLQVFCVHLLFCFAGLTLMGNASMLSGWRQFGLIAATFTAMLVTAKIFSKSEAKHERQPKTNISSGNTTETNWRPPTEPVSSVTAAMPLLASDSPSSAVAAAQRTDTLA
jgi:hypothetical protein